MVGRGGASEVLPLHKGAAVNILTMLKGGGGDKTFWCSFNKGA